MPITKHNVAEFNDDVKENDGYLYTTNPSLSSQFANDRISAAVGKRILPSDKTLIDIGCGDGVYTHELKKQYPQLIIEGCDPAREAIALAVKKYSNITFRVMNILSLDSSHSLTVFDVGILRGVLHHLSDQRLAIQNALTLCETLIIVEPNGNNPILKLIEKVSHYHRKHEEQSFTFRQLKDWCESSGSELIDSEYIGFVPFFFPDTPSKIIHFFQPLLEKIPIVRALFSAQIVIVCRKNRI